MESQPQNPEFRTNPENFHPCTRGDSLILKHFYFIYKFFIIRHSLQNIFYL